MSSLDELLSAGGEATADTGTATMPPARGPAINPRGIGHKVGDKRLLTDQEQLDVLQAQRDDPDRHGGDDELDRSISALERKLGKTQKAIDRNRTGEAPKVTDSDLGMQLLDTFGKQPEAPAVRATSGAAGAAIGGADDPEAGMPPVAPGGLDRLKEGVMTALRPVDRAKQQARIDAKGRPQMSFPAEALMDRPGPYGGGERQQRAMADEANRRASEDFWRNMGAYGQTLAPQMRQTMGGLLRALGEYLGGETARYEQEHQGPLEQGAEQSATTKETAKKLIDMGTSFYESGDVMSKEAMQLAPGKPMKPSIPAQAIGSALQSVSQMVVPVLAGTLSGGAGTALTLMGVNTFGQEYGHGSDEGLSPKQAAVYAGIYAILEVGTEFAPVRALMAKNPNAASWFWNFLVREVPSEILATATQSALEKISVTPEMTWEDFQQAMLMTVLSTPVAAGAQAGAVRAISRQPEAISPEQRRETLDKFATELNAYRQKQAATDNFSKPEGAPKAAQSTPFSPTHKLDDLAVVQHTEAGQPVEGIWRDEQGNVHEAPRAEPIQAPEPNAVWNLGGTDYEVEVTGKGSEKGTARLADGQEVPVAQLSLDDDAKVLLGLAPPEEQAGKETSKPSPAAKKPAAPEPSESVPPPPRGPRSLRPAQPAMAGPDLSPKDVAAHNAPVMEKIGGKDQRVWFDDQGAIVGVGKVQDVSDEVAKLSSDRKVYMAELKFKDDGNIDVVPEGDWHPEADEKLRAAIKAPNVEERKAARAAKMRQEGLDRKKINTDHDTLTDAIIKLGGINMSERLDITGDTKGDNKTIPFVGHLFTKAGDTLDGLVRKLQEDGYIPPGEEDDLNALVERIQDEIGGRQKHYSTHRSSKAQGDEEEENYLAERERERELAEQAQDTVDVELEHNVTPDEFKDEDFKATPARLAAVDLLRQLPEEVGERLAMQHAESSDKEFLAALEAAVKERHEKAEPERPAAAETGVRKGAEDSGPPVREPSARYTAREDQAGERAVRPEAGPEVKEESGARYEAKKKLPKTAEEHRAAAYAVPWAKGFAGVGLVAEINGKRAVILEREDAEDAKGPPYRVVVSGSMDQLRNRGAATTLEEAKLIAYSGAYRMPIVHREHAQRGRASVSNPEHVAAAEAKVERQSLGKWTGKPMSGTLEWRKLRAGLYIGSLGGKDVAAITGEKKANTTGSNYTLSIDGWTFKNGTTEVEFNNRQRAEALAAEILSPVARQEGAQYTVSKEARASLETAVATLDGIIASYRNMGEGAKDQAEAMVELQQQLMLQLAGAELHYAYGVPLERPWLKALRKNVQLHREGKALGNPYDPNPVDSGPFVTFEMGNQPFPPMPGYRRSIPFAPWRKPAKKNVLKQGTALYAKPDENGLLPIERFYSYKPEQLVAAGKRTVAAIDKDLEAINTLKVDGKPITQEQLDAITEDFRQRHALLWELHYLAYWNVIPDTGKRRTDSDLADRNAVADKWQADVFGPDYEGHASVYGSDRLPAGKNGGPNENGVYDEQIVLRPPKAKGTSLELTELVNGLWVWAVRTPGSGGPLTIDDAALTRAEAESRGRDSLRLRMSIPDLLPGAKDEQAKVLAWLGAAGTDLFTQAKPDLKGVEVRVSAVEAETGREINMKEDAAAAFKDVDERITKVLDLIECVRS